MTRSCRVCLICHRNRPHCGRGLCSTCYGAEARAGRIHQWTVIRPGRAGRGPIIRLGNPDDHDPLAIERALTSARPVHVTDPDDRARLVQLVAEGQLGRNHACRVLHCSATSLDRYLTTINTLETAA